MKTKRLKKSRGKWFYGIELIIDVLVIALTYFLGYRLQRVELFPENIRSILLSVLLMCIISVIVFTFFKTYRCGKKTYLRSLFDVLLAILIIAISGVVFDYAIKGIGLWRLTIFYALILQVGAFIIIKYIMVKLHAAIIKPRDCIIVGNNMNEACRIAAKIVYNQNHLYRLKYIIKQEAVEMEKQFSASDQVIICATCNDRTKTRVIEYCAANCIDCALIPNMRDIIIHSGKVNNAKDKLMFNMSDKMDIEARFLKRSIDIMFSFIGIVLALPIFLVVPVLIFLVEKESPFYIQKRLSKNNREFSIYKFRTMIIGAEDFTGAVLATRNDARLTKLGRVLRLLRIDELPQFFNILKGDMSIVGPRPERPDIAEAIIKDLPEFAYRTLVKPGLTGFAQVNGRYDTEFKDKLLFDLFYVNNYSFILDMRIIFDTLRVLITPSVAQGIGEEKQFDFEEQLSGKGYYIEYTNDRIIFRKQ